MDCLQAPNAGRLWASKWKGLSSKLNKDSKRWIKMAEFGIMFWDKKRLEELNSFVQQIAWVL